MADDFDRPISITQVLLRQEEEEDDEIEEERIRIEIDNNLEEDTDENEIENRLRNEIQEEGEEERGSLASLRRQQLLFQYREERQQQRRRRVYHNLLTRPTQYDDEDDGDTDSNTDTDSDSVDLQDPSWIRHYHGRRPPTKVRTSFESQQLEEFPGTDIYVQTERNAPNGKHSICKYLANRERGYRFISSVRNSLMGNLIPRYRHNVAKFHKKVFCGTHSKCGNFFMSACQDQIIRIYDISKGKFKLYKSFLARNVGWSILDTALSPDNRHIIYSSWSDSIYQASIYGDESEHVALPLMPQNNQFCVFSIRFSHDGNEIMSGCNDGCIYVFNRQVTSRSLRIEGHDKDVNAVNYLDNSTHILASASDDGLTKVWDRRCLNESNPNPVGTLAGHTDGITFIDARLDGRHLITNSKDQTIKLWDLRKFSSEDAIRDTKSAVQRQQWDYRWQRVPKNMYHSAASVVQGDTSIMTYRGHHVLQTLIRSRFSPQHTTGQRFIYTGCASGFVTIYDVLNGQTVANLRGHGDCVRDVSWHPYLPEIVSSSWDNSISKWTYNEDKSIVSVDDSKNCRSQDIIPRRRFFRLEGGQSNNTEVYIVEDAE